ncbi:ParA family protein [Streptomyces goshikiensis]|uniref:ParA family protein n=1 Tax=Streptomyces TaxID=1883 RepID=UPI000C27F29D|nr:ParA family protein [Streptomyces sp. CB02120-2]PJN14583.1 phosphopantetheine--protein transferase [Streptomyces sp. CB02120-2]
MVTQTPSGDREKVVSKLPAAVRQELKVRAAEHGIDIQDAVAQAIDQWMTADVPRQPVPAPGAVPFATWLPEGVWGSLRTFCAEQKLPLVQGLVQSVQLWLTGNPSPRHRPVTGIPQRKVICNQKGGVGKTAVAAGIAQAYAEAGLRVLLIDFDPQGHLTDQLGMPTILPSKEQDTLARHMCGEADSPIKDLLVEVSDPRFGGRLHLLPACQDAFLLDTRLALSKLRTKESALEKALRPLEEDRDVIVVDCPPALGTAMDTALYYARRREGESTGVSGVVIPVQAEDSSATAFAMLNEQIQAMTEDFAMEIEYLGLVVNLYESRRGYVATSSLDNWEQLEEPRLLAVVGDLKEQREAVRQKMPLLVYAPDSEQAQMMRMIARRIS